MIDRAYVQRMAHYNRWQNENLYGVADRLPAEERRRERGAWFGSIEKTLSHILWGDKSWMSRFTGMARPPGGIAESVSLIADWGELKTERVAFDNAIIAWADAVDDRWLGADQTYYSGATKREWTRPRWVLVTHMFNHQTHHRGQVHAMLTQAGGRPSDTDLPFMPDHAP
ncbi:MAG TPA: DinB family protein [Xanthobacteraceae bacterium]|nr:DinB family protein [Xanthobacteraceae bacterium]HUC49109.1 DinB family protein [Xanthobacteraceae bacterium]